MGIWNIAYNLQSIIYLEVGSLKTGKYGTIFIEAVVQKCSVKKVFLEIS